jgi:hypothetical protein
MHNNKIKFVILIMICQLAGIIGSVFTSLSLTTLVKPDFFHQALNNRVPLGFPILQEKMTSLHKIFSLIKNKNSCCLSLLLH